MVSKIILILIFCLLQTVTENAYHPLITDDTGTQEKENFSWRLTANSGATAETVWSNLLVQFLLGE